MASGTDGSSGLDAGRKLESEVPSRLDSSNDNELLAVSVIAWKKTELQTVETYNLYLRRQLSRMVNMK